MTQQHPIPPSRTSTVRGALEAELASAPEEGLTARELSARVGISEKDVAGHLTHLAKSLRAGGAALTVIPSECLACGFVFRDRERLTRPGACPACRSTRIEPPAFRIR
ncbi:transcriptional regulator [Archangium primigenium]|uniref:transcriptional regulator n=1 Tax=[Archangium] primigenium TaxID=2792470 RepID=UPI00195DADF7|nr:transcriptional regulator [Archangium primigenium]MBM7119372.1 transcriptional regulator [Archangium primigenium]